MNGLTLIALGLVLLLIWFPGARTDGGWEDHDRIDALSTQIAQMEAQK